MYTYGDPRIYNFKFQKKKYELDCYENMKTAVEPYVDLMKIM